MIFPKDEGSLGGFFDFVPKHLRVGPWFYLAPIFIASFAFAMVWLKPPLDFEPKFPAPMTLYNAFDVLAAANGVFVLNMILGKVGPAPLCTYTIWSWCILTFRCASSAFCSFFPEVAAATGVAWLSEFFRFPALVAASITFIIWNFVLAPIFYTFLLKTPQSKKNFVAWNTQFHMFEIHVLNYPIAVVNAVLSTGSRPFTDADLWSAFFVVFNYSILYLFILDRLGVHLYPVFSPRSKFSTLTWLFVFSLYYATYKYWNIVLADVESVTSLKEGVALFARASAGVFR